MTLEIRPTVAVMIPPAPGRKPREVLVDLAGIGEILAAFANGRTALVAAQVALDALAAIPRPADGVAEAATYCGARHEDGNYCELDDGHPGTHAYTDTAGREVTWGDAAPASLTPLRCHRHPERVYGACPECTAEIGAAIARDKAAAVRAGLSDDADDMGDDPTDSIAEDRDADVAELRYARGDDRCRATTPGPAGPWTCTAQAGHGVAHMALSQDGRPLHRWPLGDSPFAEAHELCAEIHPGGSYMCELPRGHDGGHSAPSADDGSGDIAWDDAPPVLEAADIAWARTHPDPYAATIEQVRRDAADCECVLHCAEDPKTACSLSGEWHVHPEWPCAVHPDAPGDRPAAASATGGQP